MEAGLALAEQGLENVAEQHGESDWRFDQGLLVKAYCSKLSGDAADSSEGKDAACRLLQRWPDDGWFHQQALRLGAAIQPVADIKGCYR